MQKYVVEKSLPKHSIKVDGCKSQGNEGQAPLAALKVSATIMMTSTG